MPSPERTNNRNQEQTGLKNNGAVFPKLVINSRLFARVINPVYQHLAFQNIWWYTGVMISRKIKYKHMTVCHQIINEKQFYEGNIAVAIIFVVLMMESICESERLPL